MFAAAAMSSMVVASKPRVENRSNATRSSSARLVAGRRPRRAPFPDGCRPMLLSRGIRCHDHRIPEGPRDSDVTDEPASAQRRVAVVTGAARGIGAATVRRLVGNGWRVVAVDRCADDPRVPYPLATRADLESLAAEHPDAVLDFVADVQDVDALREAVALAEQRFGGLDAAVAAAGVIAGGKPLWEAPATEWEALFGVCVTGVANLARAAIPALLRQEEPRSGRFVAVA